MSMFNNRKYAKHLCECSCGEFVKCSGSRFVLGHYSKTYKFKSRMRGDNNPMRNPKIAAKIAGKNSPQWIPRETRFCKCGCNQTFECLTNSNQKFIYSGHSSRGSKRSLEFKMNQIGKKNPNWVKRETRECKCKCGEIFECKVNSKQRYIHAHNIRGVNNPMKRPEVCIKFTGKNNCNWQGGISFEPYSRDFNNKLKKLIRKRDHHICQLCNKTKRKNRESLSVHHIDYDKKNSKPRNLISLCRQCNTEVNNDREFWTPFFQRKINIKKKAS